MTLLLLLACSKTLPAGGERPDIVLISVDTLRADHLGTYGYERSTSPHLDALAARGVRFENARSPSPWTLPTHTTMLTGLMPPHHNVVDDGVQIAEDLGWLPEQLQGSGYATGGFVSTLFVGRRFGFDRGFDVFEDFEVTKKNNLKATVDAEDVIDEAMGFVRKKKGQEVFLFLHFYDVHYPYDAPAPYDTQFDRPAEKGDPVYKNYKHYLKKPLSAEQMQHQVDQYDEEIAYVDAQIGRLLAAWDEAGRDLVILVTSDHGEEFGERGSWGHAHTLYPEQLHVPFILAGPPFTPARVGHTVGTQDIAPTLAEIAGVSLPEVDGMSLVQAAGGAQIPERPMLCDTSRFDTNRMGLYLSGERLDWDLKAGEQSLYRDPAEATAVEDPERTAALQGVLVSELGLPWSSTAPATSAGVLLAAEGPVSQATGSFAVVPVDAIVRVGDQEYGVQQPPPPGAPLVYAGRDVATTTLSEEQRAALEELGYMQ